MIKNYVTIALRSIRRHPGNALINILGLSIGIASFLMIMMFVQDQLSYDTFHKNADRIYRINKFIQRAGLDGEHHAISSGPTGQALEVDFPEVQESVRLLPWFDPVPLGVGDKTIKVNDVVFADASFFDVFSFELLKGDPATALVAPQSIVLSKALSQRLFGDDDPIGSVLTGLNDHLYTVTGIVENVPENSHLRYEALISWSSTVPGEGALQFDWMNRWMTSSMYTFVLLQEDADAAAFGDKLPAFLERHYAEGAAQYTYYAQPLSDIHLNSTHIRYQRGVDLSQGTFVYVFAVSALLVLLIACINFVNMSTALADDRSREVGVRKALGADRGQLVKQFLGESVILTTFAFAISIGIVQVTLPFVESIIGKQLQIGLIGSVTTLVLVLLAIPILGTVAGYYPAIVLSRFKPVIVLRGSGDAYAGGTRLRKLLVTLQFTISTVLLAGSLVVYQQTDYMRSRDIGIDKDQVLVIPLVNTSIGEHYEAFRERVLDHPQVLSVAAGNWVPGDSESTWTMKPEGRPDDEEWVVHMIALADDEYAETYGLEMAEGRFFDEAMATDATNGIVINETFARLLGWDRAVGRRLDVEGELDEGYVIGVLKDFNLRSLQHAIDPVAFVMQDRPSNLSVRVSPEDAPAVLDHLESTWQAFESRYPFEYSFVDDTFAAMYESEQRLSEMLSLFALLAILVACMGLFALATLMARRRTKEIGIRKTLGASVTAILRLMTGDLVRPLALATLIAVPLAYLTSGRWLESFAYRIEPGVLPFVAVGVTMILIGLVAVSYQSIRAATTNPVESLKYE